MIEESMNRVNQNNSQDTTEYIAIKYLITEVIIDISIIKVHIKKIIKIKYALIIMPIACYHLLGMITFFLFLFYN